MDDLEREAIAVINQYGFVLRMNPALRGFIRRVAVRLNWVEVQKIL